MTLLTRKSATSFSNPSSKWFSQLRTPPNPSGLKRPTPHSETFAPRQPSPPRLTSQSSGVAMPARQRHTGYTRYGESDALSSSSFLFVFPLRLTPSQHTEKSVYKPKILLLEARDICGSATGRNGLCFRHSSTHRTCSQLTRRRRTAQTARLLAVPVVVV